MDTWVLGAPTQKLSLGMARVMISVLLIWGSSPFHHRTPGTTWHPSQSVRPIWTRVSSLCLLMIIPQKKRLLGGRDSACKKYLHYFTPWLIFSNCPLKCTDVRYIRYQSTEVRLLHVLCHCSSVVTMCDTTLRFSLGRSLIYSYYRVVHFLLSLLHRPKTQKWFGSFAFSAPTEVSFHSHVNSFRSLVLQLSGFP